MQDLGTSYAVKAQSLLITATELTSFDPLSILASKLKPAIIVPVQYLHAIVLV